MSILAVHTTHSTADAIAHARHVLRDTRTARNRGANYRGSDIRLLEHQLALLVEAANSDYDGPVIFWRGAWMTIDHANAALAEVRATLASLSDSRRTLNLVA